MSAKFLYDELLAAEQEKTKEKLELLGKILRGEVKPSRRRSQIQSWLSTGQGVFDPGSIANMFIRYVAANAVVSSGVASIPNTGTLGAGGANANNLVSLVANPTYTSADVNFNNKPTVYHNLASLLKSNGTFSTTFVQPCTWYAYTNIVDTGNATSVEIRIANTGSTANAAAHTINPSSDVMGWSESNGITKTTTAIYGKHLSCIVYNGASTALYIDDMVNAVTGGSGTGGSGDITSFRTGCNDAAANYAWAEMIGYSGTHDATARTQVKSYFTTQYG
jgi:hypothetical protein